ncbi:hypothetical protein MASR2M78_16140 [Treponema sp.]
MIDDSSLNSLLLGVEKPARYVGGEYGSIRKESSDFKMAIAFPDLYEIGMSNQALRIIYNSVNKAEGVSCERVFAPAPDFEKALAEAKIPLFTLESRIPLYTLDLIGFTFGYELGISSLLSILQSGQIPLRAKERNNKYPIIIMGGPAASNPMPFSPFIDAVWVGEAEQDFPPLLANLRN